MGAVDTKMIKSARRVLEVLEFFDQEHSNATVMDIARTLGYPQSSTSELLRCLVALGYLHYNRYTRNYQPTARVALIGAWVEPDLFREGALLPMVDCIAHRFDQTVTLSVAAHYRLQHIHVVSGTAQEAPHLHVGDTAAILHRVAGRLLLSTYRDVHIRSALRRLNADETNPELRVCVSEEIERLRLLRHKGWEIEIDGDRATLAVMLPPRSGGQRIVLSVLGKAATIVEHADEIRAMIAEAHIGRPALTAKPASNDDHVVPRGAFAITRDHAGIAFA
ncbi:MAG: IclR family transcriptional regulator [Sphingomicrobium sp.]